MLEFSLFHHSNDGKRVTNYEFNITQFVSLFDILTLRGDTILIVLQCKSLSVH